MWDSYGGERYKTRQDYTENAISRNETTFYVRPEINSATGDVFLLDMRYLHASASSELCQSVRVVLLLLSVVVSLVTPTKSRPPDRMPPHKAVEYRV